ncbi:MAG: glycosyltransferase family 4 protein [Candidatus Micrarchaeaceae archaeon]
MAAKYNLTIIPNTLATFGGGEHLAFEMANKLKGSCNVRIVNPVSSIDMIRTEKGKLLKEHGIKESQVVDVECKGMRMKAFGTEDFILMVPTMNGKHRLAETIKKSDSVYCITNNPFIVDYAAKVSNKYNTKFVFAIQNRIFASYFEKSRSLKDIMGTAMYRRILRKIKYFHALNSFDANLVKRNLPKAIAYTIPGFTSLKKPRVSTNSGRFVALWVGRLPEYQKGVDLLCDVIKRTVEKDKDIEFRIVGAGGDGEHLVKSISKTHKDNVSWLGFVPYDKVKRQYSDSDLLLFTARGDELRYFPLVFLEGQSFGLPIVAFDGNSHEEIVDSTSGKLIKAFDTGKFSDAVIEYHRLWVRDRKRYLKLKARISDITMDRYSEEAVIPKMARMLIPDN